MGQGRRAGKRERKLVTAGEIASFAYCPEQWRLEYGLALPAGNRVELEAGTRHHSAKAVAERLAGAAIVIGRILVVLAILAVLMWMVSR